MSKHIGLPDLLTMIASHLSALVPSEFITPELEGDGLYVWGPATDDIKRVFTLYMQMQHALDQKIPGVIDGNELDEEGCERVLELTQNMLGIETHLTYQIPFENIININHKWQIITEEELPNENNDEEPLEYRTLH